MLTVESRRDSMNLNQLSVRRISFPKGKTEDRARDVLFENEIYNWYDRLTVCGPTRMNTSKPYTLLWRLHSCLQMVLFDQIQLIKRLINSMVFKLFLIVIRCSWETDSSYCLGYCLKYLFSKVSNVTDCSSANQTLRLMQASSKRQRVGNLQRIISTRQ